MSVMLESRLIAMSNPHVQPFLDSVEALMTKYCLGSLQNGPNVRANGDIYFTLDSMPILPFFIDLAALCEVPIEQVHVSADIETSQGTYDSISYLEIVVSVDGVFRESPGTPRAQHE